MLIMNVIRGMIRYIRTFTHCYIKIKVQKKECLEEKDIYGYEYFTPTCYVSYSIEIQTNIYFYHSTEGGAKKLFY